MQWRTRLQGSCEKYDIGSSSLLIAIHMIPPHYSSIELESILGKLMWGNSKLIWGIYFTWMCLNFESIHFHKSFENKDSLVYLRLRNEDPALDVEIHSHACLAPNFNKYWTKVMITWKRLWLHLENELIGNIFCVTNRIIGKRKQSFICMEL